VRRGEDTVSINHSCRLVKAQFSPRGNAIAIAGWQDYVELWTIPGGELLHQVASPGGVGDFAFSSDGARIAVGEIGHGGGRYVRHVLVYEVGSGKELARHSEHDWQVSRVELSPDGRWLASVGHDIVVWDLDRRRVLTRFNTDRVTTGMQFLRDGRLLVVDQGRARVFRDGKQLLEWEVPVRFRTKWCLSDDERTLSIAMTQSVARFDLEKGALRGTWAAAIARPEHVPNAAINRQVEARTGAALWRTKQGNYLHQSDGPRGWVQPLHLSPEGIVAVPTKNGATILRVEPEVLMLGLVSFEGKLRASRIVDGHIMLVNERGQVFRQRLPMHGGRSS
jgi:WD40 repeat protein